MQRKYCKQPEIVFHNLSCSGANYFKFAYLDMVKIVVLLFGCPHSTSFLQVIWLAPTVQKHTGRWTGYAILPYNCEPCMNDDLQCTGIPSVENFFFNFAPSIPRIEPIYIYINGICHSNAKCH